MDIKKNIVFALILAAIIVGGAVVIKSNNDAPQATSSPVPSVATPKPSDIDITKFTKPATCQLSGSIEFVQKNIFASKNALIAYQGIDNDARLIKWSVTPKDELSIGPNLFASLDIPDGSRSITIALPPEPKARSYTLTASITYGRWINDVVVVKEARCTGSIPVLLSY